MLRHGDHVQIKTDESTAGKYNVLGAWDATRLYYLAAGTNATHQAWTVQKLDPTDPEIHYGDQICFLSRWVTDQTLQPIWNAMYKTTYLTTKAGAKSWWTISK